VTYARGYASHRNASQINGRHRFVSAPTFHNLNPATLRIHLHLNERSIRRPVRFVAPLQCLSATAIRNHYHNQQDGKKEKKGKKGKSNLIDNIHEQK